MKSKKLLFSTVLILGGMTAYLFLGSNSGGKMGVSTIGCGGGGCHAAGSATTLTLTGVPASGFTAGTTYTVTLSVVNSSKTAAGFDLSVTSGSMSAAPPNTMLMGGTELHHTSPKIMTAGMSQWVFNWTAPAAGSAVTFNVSGNAVNNTGNESGDAWAMTTFTFNKAIPASVETIENATFSLYPNPVMDLLRFKSSNEISEASFRAITLTGSVFELKANKMNGNEYQLPISSLPAGQYILHAIVNGKLYAQHFSKQ